MSLLASIFGTTAATTGEASALFDAKDDNYEPSSIPSSSTKNKKRRALDDDDDDKKNKNDHDHDSSSNSSNSSSDDSDSDSSTSSNDDDDEKEKQTPDKKQDKPKDYTTTATTSTTTKTKNTREDSQTSKKNADTPTITDEEKDTSKTQQQEQQQSIKNPTDDNKDDDKEAKTVFVGNLPNTFTRKLLEKLFGPCGKIESTRIRAQATTGIKLPPNRAGNQKLVKKVSANLQKVDHDAKASVVGYVVFAEAGECIDKALELNNTLVPDPTNAHEQRRIRVDHSKSEFDAARSVFVGSLPYRTDEETLRAHFVSGCGIRDDDIQGVRVVRDKQTHQCQGFAYILFRDKALVATALRFMHGSTYMTRELRVLVCSRRFNSNKKGGGPRPKKKKPRHNGDNNDDDGAVKPGVAAMRRILEKEDKAAGAGSPTKRLRGKKPNQKPTARKSGMSRKAVIEAKANKRVKKLQKRLTKGMGKTKHG